MESTVYYVGNKSLISLHFFDLIFSTFSTLLTALIATLFDWSQNKEINHLYSKNFFGLKSVGKENVHFWILENH
ncbi:MAG: hypothetical protein ACI8WB_002545 [Phenylobacterium sp.]